MPHLIKSILRLSELDAKLNMLISKAYSKLQSFVQEEGDALILLVENMYLLKKS